MYLYRFEFFFFFFVGGGGGGFFCFVLLREISAFGYEGKLRVQREIIFSYIYIYIYIHMDEAVLILAILFNKITFCPSLNNFINSFKSNIITQTFLQ